jgi:hypothetical protein
MPSIPEGWYIPAPDPNGRTRYNRWVLGEIRGMVRYSKGGTEHFMCQVETFRKWLKRYDARPAEKRRGS